MAEDNQSNNKESFIEPEGIRSAAARGQAPAAHGDGPAGRGPKSATLVFNDTIS